MGGVGVRVLQVALTFWPELWVCRTNTVLPPSWRHKLWHSLNRAWMLAWPCTTSVSLTTNVDAYFSISSIFVSTCIYASLKFLVFLLSKISTWKVRGDDWTKGWPWHYLRQNWTYLLLFCYIYFYGLKFVFFLRTRQYWVHMLINSISHWWKHHTSV